MAAWEQLTNLTTGLRSRPLAGFIGGKLYVAGGDNYFDGAQYKTWEHDPATSTLVEVTSGGSSVLVPHIQADNNGAVVTIGGQDCLVGLHGNSTATYVDYYNPVAKTWTTGETPPTSITGPNAFCTITWSGTPTTSQQNAIANSGATTITSSQVRFRLLTAGSTATVIDLRLSAAGSIVQSVTIPAGTSAVSATFAQSFATSARIYATVSTVGTGAATLRMDLVGTSSFTSNIAVSLTANATVGYNSKLYSFGGSGRLSNTFDRGFIWDPAASSGSQWIATDMWRQLVPESSNGDASLVGQAAAVYSGKCYLFGGLRGGTTAQKWVLIYDFATDTWTRGDDLPVAVSYEHAATIGSKIYVTTGDGNNTYVYTPGATAGSQWSNASVATPIIANSYFTEGGYASNGTYFYIVGGSRQFYQQTIFQRFTAVTTVTATATRTDADGLVGTGTATATGLIVLEATATLTGSSAITVVAPGYYTATATLTATSELTAYSPATTTATATLTATSTGTATATVRNNRGPYVGSVYVL